MEQMPVYTSVITIKKKVKVVPTDGSATAAEPYEKVETDPVDKKEYIKF